MKKFADYLKRRLFEPSTYMGLVGMLAPISSMPSPWKWFALAMGILGITVSDSAIKQWAESAPE